MSRQTTVYFFAKEIPEVIKQQPTTSTQDCKQDGLRDQTAVDNDLVDGTYPICNYFATLLKLEQSVWEFYRITKSRMGAMTVCG